MVSLRNPYANRSRVKEEGKAAQAAGETVMLDLIFIALVIIFFVVSFWYVRFCERV